MSSFNRLMKEVVASKDISFIMDVIDIFNHKNKYTDSENDIAIEVLTEKLSTLVTEIEYYKTHIPTFINKYGIIRDCIPFMDKSGNIEYYIIPKSEVE